MCFLTDLPWKDIIGTLAAVGAVWVAYISFYGTFKLNAKQKLLDIAIAKAQDCNEVFVQECETHGYPSQVFYLFYDTISAMVISTEQINNAFRIFTGTYWPMRKVITPDDRKKIVYAYWKQLSTGVRGLFCNYAFKNALLSANTKDIDVRTYGHQLKGIYEFCILIENDMENAPKTEFEELVAYLSNHL